MTRRNTRVIASGVLGIVLVGLASACGANASDGSSGDGQVEVFTWWTSGGEKAGLDGLAEAFAERCPGQEFVNAAIAGGTGSNSKQVLASRLQQSDPPETFQVHAGAEILDYITAGQVEDLNDEYAEWGLNDAFPQGLLDSMSYEGKIYSVPVNIHRIMLWSNTALLEDVGADGQPTSIDALIGDLRKLKAAGVPAPLAMGVDWTQLELLEAVLLANLGAEGFSALWSKGADWGAPEVSESLDTYKELLTYTNDDRDSLDWTDAEKLLVNGKAGYQLMGDWQIGELETDGFTDYAYQAFPETEDHYQWLADAFVLPVGAANAEGATCWLQTVGSADGQRAFNIKKGSIPARTDADPADYPEYQQSAMADFKTKNVVPSCAHGSACTIGQTSAINSAIGKFSQDGDTESLREAISAAVEQFGPEAG